MHYDSAGQNETVENPNVNLQHVAHSSSVRAESLMMRRPNFTVYS